MEQYELLPKLVKEYGEPLIKEIAMIAFDNGQGDCYDVRCSEYCCTNKSCLWAIEQVVKDILKEEVDSCQELTGEK